MSGISALWLILGMSLGWAGSWLFRRQQSGAAPPVSPAPAENDQVALLQDQLHQTELAYHMAVQMGELKGNFLARTSHELRSPLNGLIGMNQLILADLTESPEEEREFITQANESALKMVKVLDQVIDAAKVEQGTNQITIQPVQLLNLFQGVHSLTHLQAQNRNLRLTIAEPDPDLYVLADLKRLRHVLVMVVDAAIAHADEGRIDVTVANTSDRDRCLILINTPVAAALWSDDMTAPPTQIDKPQVSRLNKAAIAALAQAPFPHPGYTFAIARSLMRSMHGDLTLTIPAEADAATHTQLDCVIPCVRPDTSIH